MNDPFIRGIVGKDYDGALPEADTALIGPRLHAAARAILRAVQAALAHHNVPRLTVPLSRFLAEPPDDSTGWRRRAYSALLDANAAHARWWCDEGVWHDSDLERDDTMRRYLSVVLVIYEAQSWLEDYETATLDTLGARAAKICRWGVRAGRTDDAPADGYGLLAAVLAAGADRGERATLRRLAEAPDGGV